MNNIDDDGTNKELWDLFSSYDTITSVKVMRVDKGISKGLGFFYFSNLEEANKVVKSFNGKFC